MNVIDRVKRSVVIEDYSDLEFLKQVCETFKDSTEPLFGENEYGELIEISVFPAHVVVRTHQSNHWDRINTYWLDGTVEETFDSQARKEYLESIKAIS